MRINLSTFATIVSIDTKECRELRRYGDLKVTMQTVKRLSRWILFPLWSSAAPCSTSCLTRDKKRTFRLMK